MFNAIWKTIERNLLAGVLVIVPAGVTAWLVVQIWVLINDPLQHFFSLFAKPNELTDSPVDSLVRWLLDFGISLESMGRIPGFGLLLILCMIFLLGLTARSLVGRTLISLGERLVERVPLMGMIYSGLKQVLEAIMSEETKSFREAVLIQYPRKGLWSVAFMTGPASAALERPESKDEVFCFVPTTPNPTSGMLVAVNREDIVPLQMSVDEAVKLVISGGILAPTKTSAKPKNSARLSEVSGIKSHES